MKTIETKKLKIIKGNVYLTEAGDPVIIHSVREEAWGIVGEFIFNENPNQGILQSWDDSDYGIIWTNDQILTANNLVKSATKKEYPEYYI